MTTDQKVDEFNSAARTLKSAMREPTLTAALEHAHSLVDPARVRLMVASSPATAAGVDRTGEDLSATAAVHRLLADFETASAHALRASGAPSLIAIPAMGLGIDLT